MQFQSTLPVWGATAVSGCFGQLLVISIHAPRVGSDMQVRPGAVHNGYYFNPRSPWGERPYDLLSSRRCTIFQSTLPVGGATIREVTNTAQSEFQSTLPVGGATDSNSDFTKSFTISIHAPRVGSDHDFCNYFLKEEIFQSTLPVWGATDITYLAMMTDVISIHAPRVGSDMRSREPEPNIR